MSVNSELDEILSDGPSAVDTGDQSTTTAPTAESAVNRDDAGRFAPKATPVAEGTDQGETAPSAQPTQSATGVPVAAVQAERDRRQEAQQENETLRRQLAEMQGQITLLSQQRQPPQQQVEQPQPPALWDNPEAFLNNMLTPIQSKFEKMQEDFWESQASAVHTPELLNAAKVEAEKLFGTPQGKVLHQQLVSQGGNPFDNLVKWHKQQQAIARVGNDPDAWLQAELEKRLADPAEQAKILERIRTGAPAQNNGKPVTNIPPSLSRMPSGGNTAQDTDMSDAGLFNFATSR